MTIAAHVQVYETPSGLTVRRLQPAIGAEILGLDLRQTVSPAVFRDLNAALLAHGVVFLRDQDIGYREHVALGTLFGEVVRDGSDPLRPEIIPIKSLAGAKDQSADSWHSDDPYMTAPPSVSILRAINLKSFGGDTCFASGNAAYEGLSPEMKTRIAGLRATASLAAILHRAGHKTEAAGDAEKWRELIARYPVVDHPVVRLHPETGKPILYVSESHTVGIVGMDEAEGRELIRTLAAEFKRPEYQARWNWRNGSIAIWDNRAVHHYAVPDQQHDRHLERITVRGSPSIALQP